MNENYQEMRDKQRDRNEGRGDQTITLHCLFCGMLTVNIIKVFIYEVYD